MSTRQKLCSVCASLIERDDAPVISMGIGDPRLICESCEDDFSIATTSRDTDEIRAAMDRIGEKLTKSNADRGTFRAVNTILSSAAARAKSIEEGKYDFALDDNPDPEGFDEIPEELVETEEDRRLDEEDVERAKKIDKIFNYVALAAFGAVAIFVIWRILDTYLF